MTYEIGDRALAYLALLIPTAASILLWTSVILRRSSYYRRFRGWRLAWEMWGSSLLITAVLFGGFYWYLFWNSFYAVSIDASGACSLHYEFPARVARIAQGDLSAVQLEDEQLPLVRPGRRQYLLVALRDGRSFASAPASPADAAQLAEQLRAHLQPAGSLAPE